MEKILSITEVEDYKLEDKKNSYYDHYAGYVVVTSERTICILIDNQQNCCENWGYIASNDNFDEFINSDLLEVNLTDSNLITREAMFGEYEEECDEAVFVTLETSNGKLQFAVYNSHNGYYGHNVKILERRNQDTVLYKGCL